MTQPFFAVVIFNGHFKLLTVQQCLLTWNLSMFRSDFICYNGKVCQYYTSYL